MSMRARGAKREQDDASADADMDGGATKSDDNDDEEDRNPEEITQSFPQRLMSILNDEQYAEIVTWLPNGKGFVISDKKRFASEILPKHFSRKSKFTSFTRKLNRWNFTRVTRGPETGAYYHPLFQRDDSRLLLQMSCIPSKGTQQIQPMNPVALGLGTPGDYAWMMPDPNDPAAVARFNEQRQAYMQFYQQQQMMAMAAFTAAQEKAAEAKEGEEGKDDAAQEGLGPKDGTGDGEPRAAENMSADQQAAMMAFQQQNQFYAMMMAQQQQFAAMTAAGMNPMMVQGMESPDAVAAAKSLEGDDSKNPAADPKPATERPKGRGKRDKSVDEAIV